MGCACLRMDKSSIKQVNFKNQDQNSNKNKITNQIPNNKENLIPQDNLQIQQIQLEKNKEVEQNKALQKQQHAKVSVNNSQTNHKHNEFQSSQGNQNTNRQTNCELDSRKGAIIQGNDNKNNQINNANNNKNQPQIKDNNDTNRKDISQDQQNKSNINANNNKINLDSAQNPNVEISLAHSSSNSSFSDVSDEEDEIKEHQLQSKTNPIFNFPETVDFVGNGVKRIKGFISPLPKQELQLKIDEFWKTRNKGDPEIWKILNVCCKTKDNNSILNSLKAAGIKLYKQTIDVTIDKKGNVYEIPNYCICEPVIYDFEKITTKPTEQILQITLKHKNYHKKINISNYESVDKLLDTSFIYLTEEEKIKIDKNLLGLYLNGKELRLGDFLWNYKFFVECEVHIVTSEIAH